MYAPAFSRIIYLLLVVVGFFFVRFSFVPKARSSQAQHIGEQTHALVHVVGGK